MERRMISLLAVLALFGIAYGSLPAQDQRSQTGDDAALKRFLMKYNRMPFANETASLSNTTRVGDWTTCEGCKLLVAELRSIIKNPQEVAKVQELMDRMCNLGILSHYKAQCLAMVANLITVLHEIEPILDNPTAVCQELQYCPENLRESITPVRRFALLLAYKFVESVKTSRVSDVVCDECIFAISELRNLVQSASIQAELKQELHKLCRLAGQYETECSALVDQYFQLLVQELVQMLNDGRKVCQDIGFCTSQRRTASIPLIRVGPARPWGRRLIDTESTAVNTPQLNNFLFTLPRLQTRAGINAGCLVCQAAFTTIFDLLKQEPVAAGVASDMTKFVCAMVPGSMKSGCGDFMRIYSRAILQMIVSQYTPPQVCSAMGACKPEDERQIAQLTPEAKSAAVCEACQVMSQYLSFEFQQPGFQQDVVDTLNGGCTYLPGDYKLQVTCQSYVSTYMPYIMENVLAPSVLPKVCPCEDSLRSYVPPTLAFLADYIGRNIVCVTFKMCPGPQANATIPTTETPL